MVYRISDAAKFNSINLLIQQSQMRMNTLQIQASSGRAGENYADISDRSNQALRLENSFMRVKRFQDNITLAVQKLDDMEASISSIQDMASQLRTLLTGALNETGAETMSLSPQVLDMITALQNTLNKQTDGKYLFAGSMTNVRPVDTSRWGAPLPVPTNFNAPAAYTVPTLPATPAQFPVTIGATATSEYFGYYTANTQRPSVRADDNMTQTYGVTAADPAFAELFYAMRLAATASGAPQAEQRDRLQGALTLLDGLVGDLADMRANIGSQAKLLEDTSLAHGAYLNKIEGLVNDLQAVDIPQTMAKLSAEQTQLQASFITISKISEVSLVNYLR